MLKLIADTSVWIDFFRGNLSEGVRERFLSDIQEGWVGLTDIIRHEILAGARTHGDLAELRKLLSPLSVLRIADKELQAFEDFAWKLGRSGLTGKYTDLSIAFICRREGLPLLSFDSYFHRLAKKNVLRVVN